MQKIFNLICFPYAGAGASIFNNWEKISDDINIIAAQLPGREKKFTEKPFTDVQTAINCLIPEILNDIDKSIPIVIFGHCMGALLAYECARKLLERDDVNITHLIASGSPAPSSKTKNGSQFKSDEDFIKNIESITGYKHPALEIPEMRDLILPTLKADSEMNNNYVISDSTPLNIPITTIRGTEDKLASQDLVHKWDTISSTDVNHKELNGGHMFITEQPKEIISIIKDAANN